MLARWVLHDGSSMYAWELKSVLIFAWPHGCSRTLELITLMVIVTLVTHNVWVVVPDLGKLKLLDAIAKETLRLHATAPIGSIR